MVLTQEAALYVCEGYFCVMTGRDFKTMWINALSERYDEREAVEILKIWLEDRHGIPRSRWSLWSEDDFNLPYEEDLNRLISGEPIQYVVSVAEFGGEMFKVNSSVLIPRVETEDLVHFIVLNAPESARVLDIGTGSGCIPIVLGKRRPDFTLTGVDVSEDALEIARENASNLDVSVNFNRCDILNDWPLGQFDVIVSNPPYIEERELMSMGEHVVEHEPHGALFVPDGDPLLFYREIAQKVSNTQDSALLCFECHVDHVQAVENQLLDLGYSDVKSVEDITGRPRIAVGQWNKTL